MNFILTAYPYLNPSPSPSPSPSASSPIAYPDAEGVGCIDMNLVVALDTVRARDDWNAFDARVTSERAACPRVTITEPQVRTAIPNPVPVPIPNPNPTPYPYPYRYPYPSRSNSTSP